MRIVAIVALSRGAHLPKDAICINAGGVSEITQEYKAICAKYKGVHPDYRYIKIVGTNQPRSRRFEPVAKVEAPKEDKPSLTKGAKDLIKSAKLSDEQVSEIKAGEDNKIYKKEVEAYIDELA